MNKKNKNGLKWLILILVIIVTAFTVTMVACGLFKERNSEKASEEASEASEEELYDQNYDSEAVLDNGQYMNSMDNTPDFALSELPDTIEPCGMCIYEDALYVTDTFSKCVWKVTADTAEILAGADSSRDIYDKPQGGYNDADSADALFKMPWSVAPFIGGIAVSDTENNALRIIDNGRVDTINSSEDATEYNYPTGMCIDDAGNLYIADTHADEVKIVFSDGTVNTLIEGLDSPMGLSWQGGYLYIAETGKNRIVKVDTADVSVPKSSNDIEIVAGSGEEGQSDGEALSASFSSPKGIVAADDGTLYVADTVNGAIRSISNGMVSSLEIQDEKTPDAELVSPIGICVQGQKLYIGDNFGRRIFVVKR